MLNKEELKSFQEESLIDSWYNNRAENLYILNDVDKKKIEEITKGEDTYQIIADEISKLANKDDKDAFTILYKLANVLGFTFEKPTLSEEELKNAVKHVSEKLGKDFNSMDELIAYRKEARDAKNWDIADKIRIALDEVNIVLKDSKEGTTWEVK